MGKSSVGGASRFIYRTQGRFQQSTWCNRSERTHPRADSTQRSYDCPSCFLATRYTKGGMKGGSSPEFQPRDRQSNIVCCQPAVVPNYERSNLQVI